MDKIEARSGSETSGRTPRRPRSSCSAQALESDLDLLKRLQGRGDTRVLVEWLAGGEDVEKDLRAALDVWSRRSRRRVPEMLGGEHDRANASSHQLGAGGTESQTGEMLLACTCVV